MNENEILLMFMLGCSVILNMLLSVKSMKKEAAAAYYRQKLDNRNIEYTEIEKMSLKEMINM